MGPIKRIVAVDDSNIVLKMLKNVLDKEEYELHPFSTGVRALEYLVQKDKVPDLIILDIEMPEMNGYDVLERIKKMDHLENVPVIFLTANSEKKQVIKAVTGGVKDYVVKPIDKDILTKKIRILLKKELAGDLEGSEVGMDSFAGGMEGSEDGIHSFVGEMEGSEAGMDGFSWDMDGSEV